METKAFAPLYLAYAVGDDPEAARQIENYLQGIPKNLLGRIKLSCPRTNEEYFAADRWMPLYLFLASHWLGHFQFTLDIEGTQLETLPLLQIPKPCSFMQAVSVGEEAYQRLRQQHLDHLVFEEERARMSQGEA